MICCVECFNDIEVRAIISGQVKTLGDCNTCGSTDVYIYNTNKNDELIDSFNNLLDIYTPQSSLPEDFPEYLLTTLEYELVTKWNMFKYSKDKGLDLIKEICSSKYKETPDLFNDFIGIYDMNNETYLNENSLLKTYQWGDFVKEIKNNNRFHTSIMNVNVLETFCETYTYIKKDTFYYRARYNGPKILDTKKGDVKVGL